MFGFEQSEHKIFNRNFLRRVNFKIDYEVINKSILNEETIKSIFLNDFPRFVKTKGKGVQITVGSDTPKFEELKGDDMFILKSSNGLATLEISDKSLTLSFDNTSYKSSKDIKSLLGNIKTLLGETSLNKVSLNKINIIEFDNDKNPNGILHFLLNKNVIGNMDSFPNTELINHNLQSVNYRNEDFYLNLKYGMNIPPVNRGKIGQVIIDIELAKYTKSDWNDLENTFNKINNETYNVFCSLINDNTKNILNG